MIPHSQPYITEDLISDFTEMVRSGQLQSAGYRDEVRDRFCEKLNLKNLFFTQSGTHSLYWILKGLNLKPEDEVILPTYVCGTIYNAIVMAGAKPVLCDVDAYWHMSKGTVSKKISSRTKAIVVVNLFGMTLDCAPFREFGVTLINDVCQSFDGLLDPVADRGDYSFFSFHPTKFITAGNGGAFSVLNDKIPFTNYLLEESLGYSISNLNLSILDQQVKFYDDFVLKRKKLADIYFDSIDAEFTKHIPRKKNVFYRFPLISAGKDFDRIRERLEKQGVAVRRGVDALIHREIGLNDDEFSGAVQSYEQTISIPIYPKLGYQDAQRIAEIFKSECAS